MLDGGNKVKKLIALTLVFCMLLTAAACKKKNETDPAERKKVDAETIESDVSNGKVTELKITLGTTVAEVKSQNTAKSKGGKKAQNYTEKQQGEYKIILTDDAVYYYDPANADKGIIAILCYKNDAYAMRFGEDTKSDVRYWLGNGNEGTDGENINYLPIGTMQGKVSTLTYPYDAYALRCIFSDSNLYALILYNNTAFDFAKASAANG